jgi:hypothetical protein
MCVQLAGILGLGCFIPGETLREKNAHDNIYQGQKDPPQHFMSLRDTPNHKKGHCLRVGTFRGRDWSWTGHEETGDRQVIGYGQVTERKRQRADKIYSK